MNSNARLLSRLEREVRGYALAVVPVADPARRRRIMELLALGALRSRGELFADFAAVERQRGSQSTAALLGIIGTDARGFAAAVVTLRETRRGAYVGRVAQG